MILHTLLIGIKKTVLPLRAGSSRLCIFESVTMSANSSSCTLSLKRVRPLIICSDGRMIRVTSTWEMSTQPVTSRICCKKLRSSFSSQKKISKMSKVCRVNVYGGVGTIGSKSSRIKIPRPMSFLTKLNEFECSHCKAKFCISLKNVLGPRVRLILSLWVWSLMLWHLLVRLITFF